MKRLKIALLALCMIFSLVGGAIAYDNSTVISTPNAPAAIGPYSQGIKLGNLIFLSGQLPLDPASGQLIAGEIEQQTYQVMANLEAILLQAGLTFDNVVMATVYLKDIKLFTRFNVTYAAYFQGLTPPARAVIEAADIPKGALLEISMIAGK